MMFSNSDELLNLVLPEFTKFHEELSQKLLRVLCVCSVLMKTIIMTYVPRFPKMYGYLFFFIAVANPPEKSATQDDSSLTTNNGQVTGRFIIYVFV